MNNLWAIFLTGLLTGGLTCLAVQGGLLAATLAEREQERLKEGLGTKGDAVPILAFLGAKLVSYTVLGLFLGLLGSFFKLSVVAQALLQAAVAFFMIGTALNLLQVHPIFRYFAIQPPRFLTQLVRNKSKSKDLFAPALLGAFTVFIPCGTTQAMMALAIASGSPLSGALILFSFVLGTSPIFFILGYFATKLGEALHQKFMRFAAAIIILLAIFNLNNVSALLLGKSFTDFGKSAWCTVTICTEDDLADTRAVVSDATINIGPGGYEPKLITVKAGSLVSLKLVNKGGGGCASSFTIPKLGISRAVPVGKTDLIVFTAPNTVGDLPFMCSMGMYRGMIKVV